MDQNNNMPGTEPNMYPGTSTGNKSIVSLVGSIVVILVLLALGWYVLKGQGATNVVPATETGVAPQAQPVSGEADAATAALSSQGTSDETTAIERDLGATDLNSLNEVNNL